ncbi:MAG TPA: STAS domain-containing protein, partial [Blastococcus sp.]
PWWVAHPPPSRPPSRLEWESAGAHAVVGVTGDVDDLAEPELEAFVAGRWLAGCTVLEVDLSGVWSMSSVGLSVLLGVHRWCEQRGLELRLRDAPPSVWRVFEAAGLDATFAPAASHDARPPAQELALF